MTVIVRGLPVLLLLAACVPAMAQDGAKPVKMADILKAVKKRQALVKTARFTWTEQRTEIKGTISKLIEQDRGRKAGPIKTQPPEDTTVELNCSLEFNMESIRLHREGKEWSGQDNAYVPFVYDSAFHKGESRTLRKTESPGNDYPQGSIQAVSRLLEGSEGPVRILTHAYRATMPNLMPFSLTPYTVSGRVDEIEGVECVELVRKVRGQIVTRLWLAPAQDFMMVGIQFENNGGVRTRLTVRNEPDATVGWVPASWRFIENDRAGELRASVTATLGERSFNHDVPETRLALDFPPGSGVSDNRTAEVFVIKRNGEKRRVLRSEMQGTWDHELYLNTDTGLARGGPGPATGAWRVWVAGIGITMLIVVGCLYLRRRITREASAPG